MLDLAVPVSLLACHRAGELAPQNPDSQDPGPVTGTFTTSSPFPVRLDLEALR